MGVGDFDGRASVSGNRHNGVAGVGGAGGVAGSARRERRRQGQRAKTQARQVIIVGRGGRGQRGDLQSGRAQVCDVQTQEGVVVHRESVRVQLDEVDALILQEAVVVAVLDTTLALHTGTGEILVADTDDGVAAISQRNAGDDGDGIRQDVVSVSTISAHDGSGGHDQLVVVLRVDDKDDITQRLAVLQAHALQDKLAAERSAAVEQETTVEPDAEPVTGDDTWFEQGTFNLDWDEEPEKEDEPITRSTVVRDYGRARALYDEGYSLQRMRDMSLKQRLYTDYHDLWESVKVVFKAFATGEELLALPALGGLFTPDQCPDLMDVNLTNADLLHAMRLMRWAKLQGVVSRIDYANMNTEELGSLYEGLLELVPVVKFVNDHDRHSFTFDFAQGNANERKSSGSYYTPDSLVQSLIETALNPVIEQKLKEHPNDPETALLSLKVIDPACGSGHFLLAAARRIAAVVMEQKAYLGAPANVEYRKTLHEVISHCIYGVDLNPMAVELARMALWLEGFAENKPLSFIDHHLLVGNALLGVMDIDVLKLGIPSDAYKPQAPIGKGQYALTLSDKTVCATLKKRNTKERKVFIENQMDTGLNGLASLGSAIQHLGYINLDQLAADTLQAEENKAAQNARNQQAIEDTVEFKACNLLLSAFLSEKTQATESLVPTCQDLDLLLTDPEGFAQSHAAMLAHAHQVCAENHVLHWPFAFMEVMSQGGFDCVLGNPPWEKPKIEDVKWFATRLPEVAAALPRAYLR